ncbi:MAG: hypothetical protein ACOYB3_02005 [Azonexus sp.]
MGGEHVHTSLEDKVASIHADLGRAAGEISALYTELDQVTTMTGVRLNALEDRVIRYSPVFKEESLLSLDCDGGEHLLGLGSNNRGEWVPPVSGRLDPACYVNVEKFDLKTDKPARLSIWMRRKAWQGKPFDDTFLYDIWLNREGYVHHDWRAFWERGEKDRPVYWLYKVTGANSVVVDTRYVKYSILT